MENQREPAFVKRGRDHQRAKPVRPAITPKPPSASVTGSVTTLISIPQLVTELTLPPDRSARNNVHVPFPLFPLKLVMSPPSGCQDAPFNMLAIPSHTLMVMDVPIDARFERHVPLM